MRIIVTGAEGFVGRVLARKLVAAHDCVLIDHVTPSTPGAEGLAGDIADPQLLEQAFAGGRDAVIHLATVPGGAAEQDPAAAWRVNVAATAALVEEAARAGSRPRFVFASSIAVFGDPMPPLVDDDTLPAPRMIYGAHKAMMEQWIACQSRRGAIDGLSLRLPGIVARPRGPSGMKSAFMSEVFYALRAGEPMVSPVSPAATMWLMSVETVARSLLHALALPADALPESRALTLPAQRADMGALVAEIARQTGADAGLVAWEPDPVVEAGFGMQPPLFTPGAEALGFARDATLAALVETALGHLDPNGETA